MRRAAPDRAGHRMDMVARWGARLCSGAPSRRVAAGLAVLLGAGAACTDTHLHPLRQSELPIDASMPETSTPDADAAPPAERPPPTDVPPSCLPLPTAPIGFGYLTTGGVLPNTPIQYVTPSTETELEVDAMATQPLVIQIASRITLTKPVEVASNKTIVGINADAELTGSGLMIKGAMNVIVQNLRISKPMGSDTDAITIQQSTLVWIDHCDFSSVLGAPEGTYDGLIDIVHASDFVTVSWSKLHDHNRVGLIGHSQDNAAEDTGHLRVTYHHNHFRDVSSNTPRARFGQVHLFNNVYERVAMNAIASVMGAQMLVEGNVFMSVPDPLRTTYMDRDPGTVNERENFYDGTSVLDRSMLALSTWEPSYVYASDLTATTDVLGLVPNCSGPQF